MVKVAVITGSGTYHLPGEWAKRVYRNRFGEALLNVGRIGNAEVAHLPRHGLGHEVLSCLVNHRANLLAVAEWGADLIIGTSVVGIVDPELDLGQVVIFDELFFPDNRLPGGEPCTIFDVPSDPKRGHLVAETFFSPTLRDRLRKVCVEAGISFMGRGAYACMLGPRFNTRLEVNWLQSVGVSAVSQTAGPEAVLAGELMIPYALLGFTVNFSAGVGEPVGLERQEELIARSREVFSDLVQRFCNDLGPGEKFPYDIGYIRRLEAKTARPAAAG